MLTALLLGAAPPRDDARTALSRFFAAVRAHQYRAAYDFFADSVRQDVPYDQFVAGAQRVAAFRVLQQDVLDSEANLVKFKVRARLRLWYEGRWYVAVYAGQADVYRDKGRWRVLSVQLTAQSQKALGAFRYQPRP